MSKTIQGSAEHQRQIGLKPPKDTAEKLLWICLNWKEPTEEYPSNIEFSGIFDTEEKAVSACSGWGYGIGPVYLNKILPTESTTWPGFYFPQQGKE